MECLPNFRKELQKYIYKTIQKEAEGVKVDKEVAPSEFNRETLRSFSYQSYHEKVLATTPLLSAALTGAVSNLSFEEFEVSLNIVGRT